MTLDQIADLIFQETLRRERDAAAIYVAARNGEAVDGKVMSKLLVETQKLRKALEVLGCKVGV